MKLYGKNPICILVIALNPKILYMRFLTAQLNRTLFKKFINMKYTQKCIRYQESWLFKANFCFEWVKSPLESEYNLLKHVIYPHYTKFGTFQAKGSKDIELISLSLQTEWPNHELTDRCKTLCPLFLKGGIKSIPAREYNLYYLIMIMLL